MRGRVSPWVSWVFGVSPSQRMQLDVSGQEKQCGFLGTHPSARSRRGSKAGGGLHSALHPSKRPESVPSKRSRLQSLSPRCPASNWG